MLSEEELKDLYDRELKGLLKEKAGYHTKSRLLLAVSVISFIVIVFSFFAHLPPEPYSKKLFFLSLGGLFLVTFFLSNRYLGAYNKWYKKEIIGRILKAINPEWQYFPEHFIAHQDYLNANLFTAKPSSIHGEDLVTGVYDTIAFKCSELRTKETVWEGHGDDRTTTQITIFYGMFFHSNFNIEFPGSTYILPAKPDKYSIYNWLKVDRETKDISSHYPEFAEKFLVFSSNLTETKSIITPAVTEALLSLNTIYHRPIHISIINSKVSVAVEFKDFYLEPNVVHSEIEFSDIHLVSDILQINELLIRNLDLNRKDDVFNPVKA